MTNKKYSKLFLIILFLNIFLFSCAKDDSKSSSNSDDTTLAETEIFESGTYYLTGMRQTQIVNSTGEKYFYKYSISGLLYENWQWLGSGKSKVTKFGSATLSISYPYSLSQTIDCSDNLILEVSLSKSGYVLDSDLLDDGCGSVSVEITIASDKFTAITNGFKREVNTTSTDYNYEITYTYQKSSIYNRSNISKIKNQKNNELKFQLNELFLPIINYYFNGK